MICRCCSSSGRIRLPSTWPPSRRPITWIGTHSSAAGLGSEPTETAIARVIVVDGEVAGSISSWGDPDEREVTYWIGRSYWGKGIATRALNAFLTVDPSRPLHARVASDNVASRRVLEKCGFRVIATERGFAEARSGEIEEFVLRLEESGSA
jgi:RimJ/RimL family protein N-acetyltransferase